jgi:ketosteroid isomerase-like protein
MEHRAMSEQPNNPENALQVVQAWNDAWMARDLEKMKQIAVDDYVQWHSTIRKDFRKDEEFAMLVEALKVTQIHYKDIALIPMTGGAVFQTCLADISVAGKEARDVPFAMVYHTRGRQITRCDEYMDGMSLPPIEFTPKR